MSVAAYLVARGLRPEAGRKVAADWRPGLEVVGRRARRHAPGPGNKLRIVPVEPIDKLSG
jgi:hypothetical protein